MGSRAGCRVTFRSRVEVVAVAPPTGESNPAASGRSGGGIPIVGVPDHDARISRQAPSANRARIGRLRAGMGHGTYGLRSRVDEGVDAVLLTCSEVYSTTFSAPCSCAQATSQAVKVWMPKEFEGGDAGPDEGGGSAKQRAHASMVGSAKFRSGSLGLPRRLLPGLGLSACARTCPPACQSGDCRSRRRWEAAEDGLQTKSCVLARILCRARAHVRESSEQGAVHHGRGRLGQNSGAEGARFTGDGE